MKELLYSTSSTSSGMREKTNDGEGILLTYATNFRAGDFRESTRYVHDFMADLLDEVKDQYFLYTIVDQFYRVYY